MSTTSEYVTVRVPSGPWAMTGSAQAIHQGGELGTRRRGAFRGEEAVVGPDVRASCQELVKRGSRSLGAEDA